MEHNESGDKVRLPIDGEKLWDGCFLALCVNAVMLPQYPFVINDHIWSQGLYLTLDHAGAKAALMFSEEHKPIAGVFRRFASSRNGGIPTEKHAASHFTGAPEEIRDLAQAMFQLFEEQVGDQTAPIVTTGFWAEEDGIYSRDSMEDWMEHSGAILENQLKPFEDAMEFYLQYTGMEPARADLVERIYREKIENRDRELSLTKEEVELLKNSGDVHNMEACRDAFEELGVNFP